jgi:hypothetical protein
MVCTYQQAPGSLGLPAKLVFRELSWQTRGITRLGPYSLDKDSLYLNGEKPSALPLWILHPTRMCSYQFCKGRLGSTTNPPHSHPERLLLDSHFTD